MRSFPLMIVAVLLYNLVWLGGTVVSHHVMDNILASGVTLPMFSGDPWHFSLGDVLLLLSLGLLFVEVIKSTRTNSVEVLNHALSMVVFIIALIEFIVLKGFSTSTFFFITVMCLFDIVAGFTISIVAAKRDIGGSGAIIGTN